MSHSQSSSPGRTRWILLGALALSLLALAVWEPWRQGSADVDVIEADGSSQGASDDRARTQAEARERLEVESPGVPAADEQQESEDLLQDALVLTVRGIQEFSRPEPKVDVEVWTWSEDDSLEPSLVATGRSNERGELRCQVPTQSGFEVRAHFGEELARRAVTAEHAAQFQTLYRGRVVVDLPSFQAKVRIQAQFAHEWVHPPSRYHVVAFIEELPARVFRGQRRFSREFRRKKGQESINLELPVNAGYVWWIAIYDHRGDRLAMTSTERALVADEIYDWEPTLDESSLERDYYFRLQGDEQADFSGLFSRGVYVRLLDGESGWLEGSHELPHKVGKVYSMPVMAMRPQWARIRSPALGGATWRIEPDAGLTESEPDVIDLHPPVRVRVTDRQASEASHTMRKEPLFCYRDGMPAVVSLRELEGTDDREFWGLSSDVAFVRLGKRLYECRIPGPGTYRLGGAELPEVPLDGLSSLTVRVASDFPLDDAVQMELRYDGVIWESGWTQSFGSASVDRTFHVPAGRIEVLVRDGYTNRIERRSVDVGADPTRVEFRFTRS